MLEYDEWAVPGEVEYAERKATEIEAQIQRYYEMVGATGTVPVEPRRTGGLHGQ